MCRKNYKFKRGVSLYLVFTMMLNIFSVYLPNNIFNQMVFGAETYNLTGDFDTKLLNDVSSQYPIESSKPYPANTDALLEWDYDITIPNQVITLPIEDNKVFQVVVDNIDGDSVVDFSLGYVDTAGVPISVPSSSYGIYNSFEDSFISYTNYLTNFNVNPKAIVQTSDNDTGTTVDNAKFTLEENTGFSIIYNSRHYRFIWKDGKIKVYLQNDVKEGYIYDLSMNGTMVTYLSKGINLATFETEPFANTDKYLYDKIFHTADTDPWPAYEDEDKGMDISFDLPKWFDSATGTFTSEGGNNFPQTTLQFNIGTVGEKAFQVRLSDILGTVAIDPNSTSVPGSTVTKSGNRISIHVVGLEPGIIYTNNKVELSFNSSVNVVEKPQDIGTENKIYTFPFYDIIQISGSLYMQVTPFVNEHNQQLTGVYTLYNKITANIDDPSINQNRNGFDALIKLNNSGEGEEKEKIIFPLDIKTIADLSEARINAREYFIEFDLNATADASDSDENKYYSQPLYYEPALDQSVLGAPDKFSVDYYNLTALFDDNGDRVANRSNLEMGISWILGPKDKLDALVSSGSAITIDYSLEKSLTQDLDETWDTSSTFTLELMGDIENDSILGSVTNTLNNDKNEILNPTNIRIIKEKIGDTVYYKAYLDYIFEAGNINSTTSEVEFIYPNIYFLTLNYLQTTPDGEVIKHTSSLQDITLNDEEHLGVPTASNLTTDNVITLLVTNEDEKDQVSFDVDWYTVGNDVHDYLKSLYTDEMLFEENISIKMHYNLYLSQKETHFKDAFYNMTYDERVKNSSNPNGMAIPFNYNYLNKPADDFDGRLIFNNINGDTLSGTKPIDYLREPLSSTPYVVVENIPFEQEDIENFKLQTAQNINHTLRLDGLDTNTKYYGFLELVIEHENLNDFDGSGNNLIEYSMPSVIFAETTKDVLDIPDPSDVDPSVPEVVINDVNIKDATFTIKPYTLNDIDGYNQAISYEVLRLKTTPLNDIYLQNKSSISEFLKTYTVDTFDKLAYLLEDGLIKEYNLANGTYETTENALTDVDENGVKLNDISLDSNKIYYYYFRTVKTISEISNPDAKIKTYSNWVPINITTSSIQPPKDLFVKQDEEFDRETQVAIQFDAMISNIADLGVNDFLEISFRESDEDWGDPIVMDSNILKDTAGELDADGYRSFVYTVKNLEPGKTYYFKIRHRLADGTMSVYSEAVRWKTDLGDDYDKDTEVNEWDDIVKDMVEELLNTDEWVLEDSLVRYELLYLASKWENQIDGLVGKTFKLKPLQSDKINSLYIPSHIYEEILNNDLNIELEYENVTINFNSGFINDYTTSLGEIKKDIRNQNTDDYYLKIDLYPENTTSKVNNEFPISDRLTVDLNLVAFDDNIQYWENNVSFEVTKQLLNEYLSDDIKEDIEDAVKDDADATEILKLIDKYKDELLEEAEDLITEDFEKTLDSKYNQPVSKYSNNITYSVVSEESGVKITGQKLLNTNSYVPQSTTTANNKSTMNVNSDGTFIFTKLEYSFNESLDVLDDTSDALDIITKFNLYDTLSTEGTINFDAPITNELLAESYSKITSTSYNDSVSSLLDLGIGINDRTKNRPVTNANTINVLMSIYEDKTNTNIQSYKISDYVSYNNIVDTVGIEELAKSLYVAKDIGLYTNDNYFETTTVKSFIDYLTKLQEIINY